MYCAHNKCKKDEDCSKLNDSKLKHSPGKCEKKKCNYNLYINEDKPLVIDDNFDEKSPNYFQ